MNTGTTIRRASAVGFALAALFAVGCSSTTPQGLFAEMPAGTAFTTSRTDTGSFGSGTLEVAWRKEDRVWEGQHVAAFVSTNGIFLDDAKGGFLAVLGPDGTPILKFEPAVDLVWPLTVGAAWTSRHKLILFANGNTVPLVATWKVEAYEALKTRAGTFNVFRVRYTDDIGNDNTEYVSPDLGLNIRREWRRTDLHPLGPGTRIIELASFTRQ